MRLTEEQRQMAEDNINLAYYMAQKLLNHTPLEYEDLVAICLEGLCKAVLRFEPEKNYKFSTFATRVIQNQVFMANRRLLRDANTVYLEDLLAEENDYSWESIVSNGQRLLDEIITTQIAIESGLKKAFPKLTEKEKAILTLLINSPGIRQKEISQVIGIKRPYVSRLIMGIRRKIKENITT